MMKMTELANAMLTMAKRYGDREVTLVEEGTGEVRYVTGISFDVPGKDVQIEHIGYQKYQIETLIEKSGIADDLNAIFEGLF